MSDRAAPPRTGIWPPVSDALAAASYGAMVGQHVVSPAAGAHAVKEGAKALASRGRDLASRERAPAANRVGKAADRVAARVTRVAEHTVSQGLKAAPAAALASKALALASKASLPLMALKAGIDAGRGYEKDGWRGAALGAIDSLAFGRGTAAYNGYATGGTTGAVDGLTFGMMSWAAKHVPESLRGAARAEAAPPAAQPGATDKPQHLSAPEAKQFDKAQSAFDARRSFGERQTAKQAPQGSGLIGFQNKGTLDAALAAQGKELSVDPEVRTEKRS